MQISYIGMQTQEVAIKPNLKIVLRSDAQQIDEVVVTAMGIKRSEKALGYAATSVGGDKITESRTSDVMSSLAGKIAGVQISNTSSDPGSSNSVIIRGVSSLSGTNQPLYVVDGVPLNNSTVYSTDGLNSGYDFGNGANAINPDDVANMTILKGAAAYDADQMKRMVLDEIDRMPAQRREVFRLSRIEGLTNDQIAQQLHISKRTVEGHLNMALKTLRGKVGKFVCWLTFFILLQ